LRLAAAAAGAQVQEMPAELAGARITFKQFQDMALLRRNRHLVTYTLDFCAQVSHTC
jgi:hypothetical protein